MIAKSSVKPIQRLFLTLIESEMKKNMKLNSQSTQY